MTPKEYRILMKSAELKSVDRQLLIHEQAFTNMRAKATKKSGKKTRSAYRTFQDFFDYEKELKRVKGEFDEKPKTKDKFSDLAHFIASQRKIQNGKE